MLTQKEEKGEFELKRLSPVAWQHINFYGQYEFRKEVEPLEIEAMAHELSALPIKISRTEILDYPLSGE